MSSTRNIMNSINQQQDANEAAFPSMDQGSSFSGKRYFNADESNLVQHIQKNIPSGYKEKVVIDKDLNEAVLRIVPEGTPDPTQEQIDEMQSIYGGLPRMR